MADIFISYKREERAAALKLATALEGEGWTVWWDLELVGGERFDDAIEAELDEARCVIVLWSKLSVRSNFVRDEATHALEQEKLLTARIDDAKLPFGFRGLHTVDLSGQGQSRDATGLGELVKHITKRIGPPAGAALREQEPASTAPPQSEFAATTTLTQGAAGPHSEPQAEETHRDPLKSDGSVGPQMVVVPAGSYMMGSLASDNQAKKSERPPHEVVFSEPFAIGKYAVTFEEYDQFATATERELPDDRKWGRASRPVINVGFEDAEAYAEWLSTETGKRYRLPTEAEWEYAARAGTQTRFSFGDDDTMLGEYAWFGKNSSRQTHEVGTREPNPWGLHDMHGNVWEWTQDCWHANYREAPDDGSAWLEKDGGECGLRVIRGGSWNDGPRHLRSSDRYRGGADGRGLNLGFRLAQDK